MPFRFGVLCPRLTRQVHQVSASKPKTLKALLKEAPSHDDIHRTLAELQLAPDYTTALVASALMETMVKYLIATHLIPLGAEHTERIFGETNGILGSFSAKINMSYALGLIGPETKEVLHRIRAIRNFFAHFTKHASFDDSEIRAECERFPFSKGMREIHKHHPEIREFHMSWLPKVKYINSCFTVSADVSNHINFITTSESLRFPIPIEPY